MGGNKVSLLYTQGVAAVLCVGPGFVGAALLWVEWSFFQDTHSMPCAVGDCCLCDVVERGGSQHSYGWDRTSRSWDPVGPRFSVRWDPTVVCATQWDPVGLSREGHRLPPLK